ncbi:MAG: primosomal protein N' [Acidobacteria bacterium]|nr:primosomal protein N' [Acidobacteriota bacterium]
MSFVSVAVPIPFLPHLTYRIPDGMTPPARGARVLVPLGTRLITGVAIEVPQTEGADPEGRATAFGKPSAFAQRAKADKPAVKRSAPTRDVVRVLDNGPFLPQDVVDLALWVAGYYGCGAGDAINTAMPPRSWIEDEAARRLAAGSPSRTRRSKRRVPDPEWPVVDARLGSRALTAEQAATRDELNAAAAREVFHVALLHGVTGSGKTEIYLRLSTEVRARNRRVLMLVPEIGLTGAMVAQVRAAFGDRVAIQHSGLSDGERRDQWQRIREGAIDVVVGTRSAVFVPLPALGLVIVDEEHDASYKQEETPRYNGRDVAIVRARKAGALVVLGSATPSLESYHNARQGRYQLITMSRRVFDRPLASVRLVDMRQEYAERGPESALSRALEDGIDARLQAREQVLLLLNRRGFARAVFCRQCAGTLECPNCSVSLTVHQPRPRGFRLQPEDLPPKGGSHETKSLEGARARCHYCNYSMRVPKECPLCAAPYLEHLGFGTARVEEEVTARFPHARVARLDRDVIKRRGALAHLLTSFAAREIDVLVGTQMIAKGHDFPAVTLVGVVSADVGLGLPDFRAAERTFQLLTQVVGRAGRGERPGEAIIQTLYPDHYSIVHACRQDYPAFFDAELRYRRAMRYPPAVAMVNVVLRGRTLGGVMDEASRLADQLRSHARDSFSVLGPAPAPFVKLRGEYRVQLFMKGASRASMRDAVLTALEQRPELRRRAIVDVDPLQVL